MQKVIYLKEPGYINDLYFAFILYYNKEVVTDKFISKSNTVADTKFYKEAVQRFEPFQDDLLPFFYMKQDSFCFMSVKYWRDMNFLENLNFDSILDQLKDKKSVVANMMDFYLGIEKEFDGYTLQDISRMIKDLPYSDALKYHLALFFMNPGFYIDALIDDLTVKELLLRQYYNDHSDDIFKMQAEVDIDVVIEKLGQSPSKLTFSDSVAYYSINLICRGHVSCKKDNNGLFFMLGTEFKSQLDDFVAAKTPPDMVQWGKVYSEKNRITILKMLKEHGELCNSDIASRMNLSPTSVYYHVEMMFDARMLNTRNEGRTIYYSINKDYFKRVNEQLRQLAEDNE